MKLSQADLEKNHQPVVVTQDSLALLKILAMSSKSKREGKSKPIKTAFADIRININQ
jgi:hypothetical protein